MSRPTLNGRSILIVEDNTLIRMDIAQAFQKAGAEVRTATTLREAFAIVESEEVSAAILDHVLGDGDSNRLGERLKDRGIPFIMYSGYTDLEGACTGAPHVNKPATGDVLVTTIEGLLGHSGAIGPHHHAS
jgi:DNA-binding response OmpR family regulator